MKLDLPVGTIIAYGGKTTKAACKKLEKQGWLVCNGEQKDCDDYVELFSVIGSSFGVPGTGKFNLPDLRGQFLRGVSGASRADPEKTKRVPLMTGGNKGNAVGSLQTGQCNSVESFYTSTARCGWNKEEVIPENGKWSGWQCTGAWVALGYGSLKLRKKNVENRPTNVYVNYLIKHK